MNPVLPRAVIFDWDNTLVDAWDAVVAAVNEARAASGRQFCAVDSCLYFR